MCATQCALPSLPPHPPPEKVYGSARIAGHPNFALGVLKPPPAPPPLVAPLIFDYRRKTGENVSK
jgi:hypothetical protein